MKTKQITYLLTTIAIVVTMASCSKKNTIVTPVTPPSHPISAGNISGNIYGTMLTGSTYTVTADTYVPVKDTLLIQPGAIIIVKNNAQFIIQGHLQSLGTQANPVSFNSDSNTPGTWGGFACDSAQEVIIKWTKILNTGGPDNTGSARRTLVVRKPINVDIEDSWILNGQDDGLGLFGGANITILRNTIQSGGSTDGEAINIKTGTTGTVAYNVIFSQAGTGVKLETASVIATGLTKVDVYNNTMVSCGWRRGQAEPGRGVSAGVSATGNVYNNIIVNCYHGLEIFTDDGANNIKYGNNLFYSTQDTFTDTTGTHGAGAMFTPVVVNLRDGYYPSGALGVPQSTDIISKAVGDGANPLFVSFDGTIFKANGAANPNDFHLKSGSPAIGKGNTTYNADLGAYTSDGKGNKH
jgi:hypothetical protein